jgi:succinate dehydrogenase/fumarate reductase flavoprotein subunit
VSSKDSLVNRREFLKGSVATGAAIAAGTAAVGLTPTTARADIAPEKWDKEVDIVILGTGHAGLMSAIVASDAGAKVVILEKMKKELEGGNSKVSGNMWWTPDPNNPNARALAIEYITAMCYGLTPSDCIEALVDEQLKLNTFLATLGIRPQPLGIFQPEHPQLPGAAAVRTWNNGAGGGIGSPALWTPLRNAVTQRNIEVLYETPAKALIQLPTREIAGIRAQVDGKPFFIRAKKAVILACGGFEFDFEMQKQFLPGWPVYCTGSPGNTGDGIRMAQQVGAQLWHMNNALAGLGGMVIPPTAPVPVSVNLGSAYICVDKLGKRFMSENQPTRHGFGQKEYLMFFDGLNGVSRIPCYYIFDETTRARGPIGPGGAAGGPGGRGGGGGRGGMGWYGNHPTYQWSRDNAAEIEKGWIVKGETIAELATKLGMKPADLEATVTKYNTNAKNGADPDFNRPRNNLVAIEKAPFYAVAIYPTMYNTQGGPKRNAKCQIVDPFEQPIPRLYSAGEMGSFWGWMYNGGGNNAECLCTGQIAARNAVAEKPLA